MHYTTLRELYQVEMAVNQDHLVLRFLSNVLEKSGIGVPSTADPWGPKNLKFRKTK